MTPIITRCPCGRWEWRAAWCRLRYLLPPHHISRTLSRRESDCLTHYLTPIPDHAWKEIEP